MRWLLLVDLAFAWTITSSKAAVRSQGDVGDLQYQEFSQPLQVDDGQSVEVRFNFEGEGEPKQAFAVVEDAQGKYVSIPAKVRKNTARLVVPYAKLSDGRSQLKVHVASEEGSASSDSLEILASKLAAKSQEKSKFVQTNELHFEPQPEILHQFRPPPRYVSAPVALVFAGAVWALFLGLLIVWQSEVGIAVGAVPFVGSLAAIEAVFLGYYLSLSIFTTLFWTAVLGTVSVLLGHKALVATIGNEPKEPKVQQVEAQAKAPAVDATEKVSEQKPTKSKSEAAASKKKKH